MTPTDTRTLPESLARLAELQRPNAATKARAEALLRACTVQPWIFSSEAGVVELEWE